MSPDRKTWMMLKRIFWKFPQESGSRIIRLNPNIRRAPIALTIKFALKP
jgi:hypothetical protein